MKQGVKVDLADIQDCIEALAKRVKEGKLTRAEMVDVAARLKPVAKHCKYIDDTTKDTVKDYLKHRVGEVRGEIFKAVLRIDESTRLDQKQLKEMYPDEYNECCKPCTTEVVTFEAR
jgi:hypothetical protein